MSPADDYLYAYSEVKFVFSWMFTTETDHGEMTVTQPPWASGFVGGGIYNLATMAASINASTGVVSCAVGYGQHAGEGYSGPLTQMGMIAVFAFCQRARTGECISMGAFKNGDTVPRLLRT